MQNIIFVKQIFIKYIRLFQKYELTQKKYMLTKGTSLRQYELTN